MKDPSEYTMFFDNLLLKTVRINGVDYPYNSFDNIIEINGIPYNI